MSKVIAPIALLVLCGVARAQEPIPAEHAQMVGKQLVEAARQVDDLQIKADVDPDKAAGIHKDQRGALAIPKKDLSAEELTSAAKKVVPVGQLWFRGVAPVIDGQAASRERLRPIKVTLGDKEHELFLFLLGARKKDSGELELLVYGKDKEPLAIAPLKKAESGGDTPIVLDAKVNGDDTAELTLKVLGKLEAAIKVGEASE